MDKISDFRTIHFGEFYKNEAYEKEKIEWLVLSEDEEKLLVISQKSIVSRRFDKNGMRWNQSEIRQWLNTDFFNDAFNRYEQPCIVTSDIISSHLYEEPCAGSRCADFSTRDRIFLLSGHQAEKYFPGNASRVAAKSQLALYTAEEQTRNDGSWWLRDSFDRNRVLSVTSDGEFNGREAAQSIKGIRPAMYISRNYNELLTLENQIYFDDYTIKTVTERWSRLSFDVLDLKAIPLSETARLLKDTYRILISFHKEKLVPKEISRIFIEADSFLYFASLMEKNETESDFYHYRIIHYIITALKNGFFSGEYECRFPFIRITDDENNTFTINLETYSFS